MNRSLRLLRPLGHVRPSLLTGGSLGAARVSALQLQSLPTPAVATANALPRAFPPMAIRLYVAPSVPVKADDKKGKEAAAPSAPVPKVNTNVDEQHTTTGAVEEVGFTSVVYHSMRETVS